MENYLVLFTGAAAIIALVGGILVYFLFAKWVLGV